MPDMLKRLLESGFEGNYGLLTAEILYRLPDYKNILQVFLWQEYDMSPKFPVLAEFLDYWDTNLEGPIHSVTVVHQSLITPREFKLIKNKSLLN